MAVHFHFKKEIKLSGRIVLRRFIAAIFTRESCKLKDLSYVFCDDEYLLQINQSYLNHNYYTDIITFNLSEPGDVNISGEIYISVDTVARNAKDFNATISEELLRVIFHGALHLCGYNDKNKKDKLQMRAKEDYYLGLFNKITASGK
jgi:probable rRNA maturation factor